MRGKACRTLLFGTFGLVIPLGSLLGQPSLADLQRGHQLAIRLCTNCHALDDQTTTPMRTDVPSFPMIANRPGANAEQLAGRIIVPHPAMPVVSLTVAEIRDIVAYIVSLKRN
jgi:cytochrome c